MSGEQDVADAVIVHDPNDPGAGAADTSPATYTKPGEKRRGRPPGAASGRGEYKPTKLYAPIERGYLKGSLYVLKYNPPMGVLIRAQAPKCAQAWDELAKSNATVKRFLTWVVELGNRGGVVGAHAPLILLAADQMGLLEKVPFVGELWKELLEITINDLLREAIEEGILVPRPDAGEDAVNGQAVPVGGF